MEVLLRVTVRLGRYPRRGVRRGPSALRLVVVDPLRAQRDRVFDLMRVEGREGPREEMRREVKSLRIDARVANAVVWGPA